MQKTAYEIHVVFHAVVDHLLFAVSPNDDECWRFLILCGIADLYVGLLAVIKDTHWADRVIAFPAVIEIHRLDCIRREFNNLRGLHLLFLLFSEMFLPLALVLFIVRIGKRHTG